MRQIDDVYHIHLSAWANRAVKATKLTGTGKSQKEVYIYRKFEDFFDYEAQVNSGKRKHSKTDSKLAKLITKSNQERS